jgi:hypothetical protein
VGIQRVVDSSLRRKPQSILRPRHIVPWKAQRAFQADLTGAVEMDTGLRRYDYRDRTF